MNAPPDTEIPAPDLSAVAAIASHRDSIRYERERVNAARRWVARAEDRILWHKRQILELERKANQ